MGSREAISGARGQSELIGILIAHPQKNTDAHECTPKGEGLDILGKRVEFGYKHGRSRWQRWNGAQIAPICESASFAPIRRAVEVPEKSWRYVCTLLFTACSRNMQ